MHRTITATEMLQNKYQEGLELYNQKKFKEALIAFNSHLEIKENDIDALYKKGLTHFALKEELEASNDFKKIVSLEPSKFRAHYLCGVGLYSLKKYEDSLIALNECLKLKEEELNISDKSLKLNVNYYHAYYYRAYAIFYLNRKEEAQVAFKKLIEVAPDNYDAWRLYANGLFSLKQYHGCLEACEKSLSLCEGHLPTIALKNKVMEILKSGEKQEADREPAKILTLERSGPIEPASDAELFKNSGDDKLESGDSTGAIVDFTESLRLKPDNESAFENRGVRLESNNPDAHYCRAQILNMITDQQKTEADSEDIPNKENKEKEEKHLQQFSSPKNIHSLISNTEDKKIEQEKIKDVLEELRTLFLEERNEGEKNERYAIYNQCLKHTCPKAQLVYKHKQKKHVLYIDNKPIETEDAAQEITKIIDSLEKPIQPKYTKLEEEFLAQLRRRTFRRLPEKVESLVKTEIAQLQQAFVYPQLDNREPTAQSFKFFAPASTVSETPIANIPSAEDYLLNP